MNQIEIDVYEILFQLQPLSLLLRWILPNFVQRLQPPLLYLLRTTPARGCSPTCCQG